MLLVASKKECMIEYSIVGKCYYLYQEVKGIYSAVCKVAVINELAISLYISVLENNKYDFIKLNKGVIGIENGKLVYYGTVTLYK